MRVPEWTETETAYIAGIIDGEGCISLHKAKKSYTPRLTVTITNTTKGLVDWLCLKFDDNGPQVYLSKREGRKPVYSMSVTQQKAAICLRRVLGYMRVKDRQAQLGIRYWQWRESLGRKPWCGPYTREQRGAYISMIQEMRELNNSNHRKTPISELGP